MKTKTSLEELEMVNGGDEAAAKAYMRELCRKYGVRSPLQTLSRATEEEFDYLMKLYEM